MNQSYKIPISVLVVIHTPDGQVLLLERVDHPGWWQSVTGSQEPGETLLATVQREVEEETGLRRGAGAFNAWGEFTDFEIYACYQHRYVSGTTHNREHVFSLELPVPVTVQLAPNEHLAQRWLPWTEAAAACFSPSNAAAIRRLGTRLSVAGATTKT